MNKEPDTDSGIHFEDSRTGGMDLEKQEERTYSLEKQVLKLSEEGMEHFA